MEDQQQPGAAEDPAAVSAADIGAGRAMAREIAEQPAVLAGLLRDHLPEIAAVAARIKEARPRFVLFAARGTSDNAALYGKYLVEIRLGVAAGLISPSTTTLYHARPDLRDVLFVAVSQSGSSPDLVESMAAARSAGALTVAVTNAPGSDLDRSAELSIDVHAGAERAVAATKSYTAELLALYLLFGAESLATVGDTLAPLADAARATLGRPEAVSEVAARYRYAEQMLVVARGLSYPTAREAALKLIETSYLGAQAYSGADILHGPMAMVSRRTPSLAIVTPGAASAAMADVVRALRERGSDIVTVGGPAADLPTSGSAGSSGSGTGELPELVQPILEILPLQQLAWRLALDRGGDPDRPAGLSKVTLTR